MFDWVFELLYGITKSILQLIDGIMSCANKLCGIEPIQMDGVETDFLTVLFKSDEINFAFRIAAILATIVIVFFSIFAILRTVAKEKPNETPAQIGIKTAKTILMFLFVPACMVAFMWILNVFMTALYSATLGGSPNIGTFLFGAFSDGAWLPGKGMADVLAEGFDYSDTDMVWTVVDLYDYNFFFSWIAGLAILICVSLCMISFVERAISIVILYIAAPFSLASSVLDDGARFKLWRDQVLVKFINGYGMIIGVNIYALVIGLVCRDSVVFFENSFFNFLMKIIIILGGAYSLQKIMAVVGNLISAGAGTQEARDAIGAAKGTFGALGKATMGALKGVRGAFNFTRDSMNYGLGSTIGGDLGFRTSRDYMRYNMEKNLSKKENADKLNGGGEGGSDSQNSNQAKYNNDNNNINNTLENNDNKEPKISNEDNNSNANHNKQPSQGQSMISNAISGNDK